MMWEGSFRFSFYFILLQICKDFTVNSHNKASSFSEFEINYNNNKFFYWEGFEVNVVVPEKKMH